MSLRYKLFGFPKTPEELAEKMRKHWLTDVNVDIKTQRFYDGVFDNFNYHTVAEFRSQHLMIKVGQRRKNSLTDPHILRDMREMEVLTMRDAIEAAEYLEKEGFDVTFAYKYTTEDLKAKVEAHSQVTNEYTNWLGRYYPVTDGTTY